MKYDIRNEFYGHDRRDVLSVLKRDGGVLGLNTTFTTPDWLQDEGMSRITSCFAPLRAFGQAFDPNPFRPGVKNMIKYVTHGSTTIVDGTDFQVGDSNVDGVEVSVSHFSQSWQVSNKDLNSGLRQADMFFVNMQALADSLMSVVGSWITTAGFPATPVTAAGSAFTLADAGQVYGRVPGANKALVLHPKNFGMLSHGSGVGFNSGNAVHGWKNGIHELSSGWSGKVRGIGCAPNAIVAVTGTLNEAKFKTVDKVLIGLPGLDLTIEYNAWYDPKLRTSWRSLDCIFGATIGQADSGVLIVEP